nr:uncharacterized serine-rich protein C215.13-like [Ipomoea batatas]
MARSKTPAATSPAMTPVSKDDESLESDLSDLEPEEECLERDLEDGTFSRESDESDDGGENTGTEEEPLEEGFSDPDEEPSDGDESAGESLEEEPEVSSDGGEGGEDSSGGVSTNSQESEQRFSRKEWKGLFSNDILKIHVGECCVAGTIVDVESGGLVSWHEEVVRYKISGSERCFSLHKDADVFKKVEGISRVEEVIPKPQCEGHENDNLPRISLDSEKAVNLSRNPTQNINPPRVRLVKPRALSSENPARRVCRSPVQRAPDATTIGGVFANSPWMRSSRKFFNFITALAENSKMDLVHHKILDELVRRQEDFQESDKKGLICHGNKVIDYGGRMIKRKNATRLYRPVNNTIDVNTRPQLISFNSKTKLPRNIPSVIFGAVYFKSSFIEISTMEGTNEIVLGFKVEQRRFKYQHKFRVISVISSSGRKLRDGSGTPQDFGRSIGMKTGGKEWKGTFSNDILKIHERMTVWIGKVESRQSVFNRLGASPKEVSPKEVKRKSVHERLGPVPTIKKHTKSPLGAEPSKEIKSAVPSRMRREVDVNVLCGEVLKIRPKIIVHTYIQEENEENMESSYATYQNDKDVEAPKNWRRERSKANCRFPPATVASRFETRSQRNGLKDMPETAAKKGKANDFISKLRIKRQPPEIKCDPHMGFRRNASVQPLFWLHHCIAIVIMSSGVQQKSQIPIQRSSIPLKQSPHWPSFDISTGKGKSRKFRTEAEGNHEGKNSCAWVPWQNFLRLVEQGFMRLGPVQIFVCPIISVGEPCEARSGSPVVQRRFTASCEEYSRAEAKGKI